MLELINSIDQVVASNANVNYTQVVVPNRLPCIIYTGGTQVKLKGIIKGNNCPCATAKFKVHFNGNVALPVGGTAQDVSIAIVVDGEPLSQGTMTSSLWAAEKTLNISSDVIVTVPNGCCSTVAVRNISDTTVEMVNVNLIIERIA